jgi:hypothetical protein
VPAGGDCNFSPGSPDQPFDVVRVARKNHGFPAKGDRRHNVIGNIRRSGDA